MHATPFAEMAPAAAARPPAGVRRRSVVQAVERDGGRRRAAQVAIAARSRCLVADAPWSSVDTAAVRGVRP